MTARTTPCSLPSASAHLNNVPAVRGVLRAAALLPARPPIGGAVDVADRSAVTRRARPLAASRRRAVSSSISGVTLARALVRAVAVAAAVVETAAHPQHGQVVPDLQHQHGKGRGAPMLPSTGKPMTCTETQRKLLLLAESVQTPRQTAKLCAQTLNPCRGEYTASDQLPWVSWDGQSVRCRVSFCSSITSLCTKSEAVGKLVPLACAHPGSGSGNGAEQGRALPGFRERVPSVAAKSPPFPFLSGTPWSARAFNRPWPKTGSTRCRGSRQSTQLAPKATPRPTGARSSAGLAWNQCPRSGP